MSSIGFLLSAPLITSLTSWKSDTDNDLYKIAANRVSMQGGENRRILLDLKTVLEDVQTEVKREEEKRSELQLQYTRDRCAWELEKAELKCRIAQVTQG